MSKNKNNGNQPTTTDRSSQVLTQLPNPYDPEFYDYETQEMEYEIPFPPEEETTHESK